MSAIIDFFIFEMRYSFWLRWCVI